MLRLRSLPLVILAFACATDDAPTCAGDNAGLTLPAGFCAQIVADSVGAARHIAVAPNGDLYIALRDTTAAVIALRDGDGDGVAEQRQKFGTRGGTGIAFFDNHLYASTDTSIVRWAWSDGALVPSGTPETIVTGFAVQRAHAAKPFAIASDGSLYVTIGAPSNSCQVTDREEGSKGQDPCPLLENAGKLFGGRVPPACAGLGEYFRDVYDHLVRINQSIDAARETVGTAIQVALAMVATRQGEITRMLAAYAALVAVPTMIAGIYGMNFKHMPELDWSFGYPLVLGAIVAIDAFLFSRFRKAGWL